MIARCSARFLLIVAIASSACAYHAPDAPTATTPPASTSAAEIRLVTSSRPDYTTAVSAEVLTAQQRFVPNAIITFAVTAGTVSPTQATTDVNGTATAIVTTSVNTTITATLGGTLAASATVVGATAPQPPTPGPIPNPVPPIPTPTPTPQPPPPLPPATISLTATTMTAGVSTQLSVGNFMGGQSITSTAWTFGDGATAAATGGLISHTYTTAGTYTASVTATDAIGRTASSTAVMTVNAVPSAPPPPPPPAPTFVIAITCGTATPTTCNLSGTYGGAPIASSAFNASWDWGDGVTTTTAPLGSHAYTQSGTFLIVATATGTSGAWSGQTSSAQKTVTIP